MARIHILRSLLIKADKQKAIEVLKDFQQWPVWSPWLIMEDDVELTYSEDGNQYTWKGNRIGTGQMSKRATQSDEKLVFDVFFLKPFRSKSVITFQIKQEGDQCVVNWVIDTNLPFSLFWGKKKMIALMSADYDRGLLMLKDYLETGSVLSSMEEVGVVTFPTCKYIGVTTACGVSEMKEQMQNDRQGLSLFVEEEEMDVTGESFTIYHKWDVVKGQVAFTVGIPVADELVGLESPFHSGKIPKLKAFKIIHEGPYRHLGNAWGRGNMKARNKEIKLRKGYPPFEVYKNDPQDTADEFLETDLYFPLEG